MHRTAQPPHRHCYTRLFRRALTLFAIAFGLLAPAQAANITRTYDFVASNFVEGPETSVSGSFTVTFDPAVSVTNQTAGITVHRMSIPYQGAALFTYNSGTGYMVIGANSDASEIYSGIGASPNDFVLQIQSAATTATFTAFMYRRDTYGARPRTTTGTVTLRDTISGGWVNGGNFSIGTTGTNNDTNNWPSSESPWQAADGDANTKFLVFKGSNAGMVITPPNPATYNRLALTTANDASERDPASYAIYGSSTSLPTSGSIPLSGLTLIQQGTLALTSVRNTGPALVQFNNTTAYRSYVVVFPTIKNSPASSITQIAEVKLSQGMTVPNQVTMGTARGGRLSGNTFTFGTVGLTNPGTNWPAGQSPDNALDGDVLANYLLFQNNGMGLIASPAGGGSEVVNQLSFWTAGDAPERDPVSYAVYGLNTLVTQTTGTLTVGTAIATGTLTLPTARGAGPTTVNFTNTNAYASYLVVFPAVKNSPSVSSITQIAEIAFANVPPATAPVVTTATQSGVTTTSATLGGNVTADGGAAVTDRGIVWNTTGTPTTSDTKVANGTGTGVFSATVSGLPANGTIFVRAYAINSVNTSYGPEVRFLTPPLVLPTIVTNTADSGVGSLRQAVLNANANAGADAITFDPTVFATAQTITLSGSNLAAFTGDTTVTGPAAGVTVRGARVAGGVFTVGAGTTASFSKLTIFQGIEGIRNLGTLTASNCLFSQNSNAGINNANSATVTGCSFFAKGISNGESPVNPAATLTVSDCSFVDIDSSFISNNGTATLNGCTLEGVFGDGGDDPIYNNAAATLTATNCSLLINGSYRGVFRNEGTLAFQNCTLSEVQGSLNSGTVTLKNTIYRKHPETGTATAGNPLTDGGGNLLLNSTGGDAANLAADLTTLGLDPTGLQNNGGPTKTIKLLSGPAINGGVNANVPVGLTTDQRGSGFARSVGTVDIGAYEHPAPVDLVATTASAAEGTGAGTTSFTFTVTRPGATTDAVTLDYTVTGTGTNPADAADFGGTLPSGSVTLAIGEASKAITIAVTKDALVEPDETFKLTLSNPTADHAIAGTGAVATITDDDKNIAPSFALPAQGPSGEVWNKRETVRDWAAVACSADAEKITALVKNGIAYTSPDFGVTWTAQPGSGSRAWSAIASSADGTKLAATTTGGFIYTSTDSGVTWTERTTSGSRNWYRIASSTDGSSLAAIVTGTSGTRSIFTSADSGATWTERTTAGSREWKGIASSADGTKLAACVGGTSGNRYIYTSIDSGATWTERSSAGSKDWKDIASSADGTILTSMGSSAYTNRSLDGGVTWAPGYSNPSINHLTARQTSIAVSADASKLAMGGSVYLITSNDGGASIAFQEGQRNWTAIAMSADGTRIVASALNAPILTSTLTPPQIRVLPGSGVSTTAGFASAISPGPVADAGQTVSFQVTTPDTALFTTPPAISPSGTLTFTPGTTYGVATVTVRAMDTGGTASGGQDTSAPQTFTIMVAPAPGMTVDIVFDPATGKTRINYSGNWGIRAGRVAGDSTDLSQMLTNYGPAFFERRLRGGGLEIHNITAATPDSDLLTYGDDTSGGTVQGGTFPPFSSDFNATAWGGDFWGYNEISGTFGPEAAFSPTGRISGYMEFDKTLTEMGLTSGDSGIATFTPNIPAPVWPAGVATMSWAVRTANAAPTFSGYAFSTPKNTPATVAVAKILARAADSDGGTLALTAVSPASAQGGSVSLNSGNVTYTPANNYTGLDTFTVTISDGQGGNVVGTVTVSVTAGNGEGLNRAQLSIQPNGNVALLFMGIPGQQYVIQRSPDLQTWTNVFTGPAAADGTLPFTDPSPLPDTGFYRTAIPQD